MADIQDRALGWDEEISQESEFILLDEGDYDFKVEQIEKSYFNGSEKMAPCPQAIVHVLVNNKVKLKTNLFLNTKSEWKLSEFFISIGLKQKGEPLRMNWAAAQGKTGRLTISHREWNGEKYNEVKKFLEPEAKASWTGGTF
ncbi:DUF669 domain-containing protein [Helcococcus kunzii]|uniref:DUF669 domain-containing protein n=1 Tax=Helcococcus kunzii ATCC 51366 TaxID=883114 RepID=H3NPF2_9FIRM|nr:DUF669 domain-containing protein [Helcococcus kunzii]EHR33465.1 hypothetical protein HMPREF9709_01213 [Helcococcus kunzii ATCC 51366]QUY65116.1 DUF669 domain-containing protein [Helcococcus kunzii]